MGICPAKIAVFCLRDNQCLEEIANAISIHNPLAKPYRLKLEGFSFISLEIIYFLRYNIHINYYLDSLHKEGKK